MGWVNDVRAKYVFDNIGIIIPDGSMLRVSCRLTSFRPREGLNRYFKDWVVGRVYSWLYPVFKRVHGRMIWDIDDELRGR